MRVALSGRRRVVVVILSGGVYKSPREWGWCFCVKRSGKHALVFS